MPNLSVILTKLLVQTLMLVYSFDSQHLKRIQQSRFWHYPVLNLISSIDLGNTLCTPLKSKWQLKPMNRGRLNFQADLLDISPVELEAKTFLFSK